MKKIVRRRALVPPSLHNSSLHPLLKNIYSTRGINSLDEINYALDQLLPISELKNIEAASDCFIEALMKQEKILIVGDFDADGATSTALSVLALKSFGFLNVSYIIPNRFEFGYGLTKEIVEYAASFETPDIILTVDNGISSADGVLEAIKRGIKVVITDHHLPPQELPLANAILNPCQDGDLFKSKNLSGVGVVFYLMLSIRQHLRKIDWFLKSNIKEPNMAQFLDLVAVGTVADLVKLDKNNRVLVHQGIMRIREGRCRPGIKALFDVTSRNYEKAKSSDLGYGVAPRINAAGRLEDMSIGVECLLTENFKVASDIAKNLNELNETRREIELQMHDKALQILAHLNYENSLTNGCCIFDPSWHLGVVGLLASKIKEKINRPVIAFAVSSEHELKGSGRSISGVHLRDVLSDISSQYPGLINKFGGHAMAVGLNINKDKYELFSKAFSEEVCKKLSEENMGAKLFTDGELDSEYISLTTAKLLQNAGPWGEGFPEPMFDGVFTILQQRIVGQKHLKLFLSLCSDPTLTLNAILFNVDTKKWPNERCRKVHVAYRLDVNEFNDRESLQLIIENMQEI